MKCKNCGETIDDNSKFCIYCGHKIEKLLSEEKSKELSEEKNDIEEISDREKSTIEIVDSDNIIDKPNSKDEKIEDELIKETEKSKPEPISSKQLSENIRKFKKSTIILSVFLFLSIIAIAIIAPNWSVAMRYNEEFIDSIIELSINTYQLKEENESLSDKLDELQSDYDTLKAKYDKEISQISNNQSNDNSNVSSNVSSNASSNENSYARNTNDEVTFLNNVCHILDKYNSAVNHMNTYHKENWVFNDPEEIALEETFLIKLRELSDELKSFSYPDSYTNQRNNFVNIF